MRQQATLLEKSLDFLRDQMTAHTKSGEIPTDLLRYWISGFDRITGEQKSGVIRFICDHALRSYMAAKGYELRKTDCANDFYNMELSGDWHTSFNEKKGYARLWNNQAPPVLYIEPAETHSIERVFGVLMYEVANSRRLFRRRIDHITPFDFDNYPHWIDVFQLNNA